MTAWIVACLAMTTVVPLLGWVFRLASFRVLFLLVALPGLLGVCAIGLLLSRHRPSADLGRAMQVGVVAGLVGTLGYDLFRTPFVFLAGFRLLSPIESYGVLLLGADGSSGLSDLVGWTYHLMNGLLFAVAYTALAHRRHWGWGVAWAFVLETGTVVTAFADVYHLWANPSLILVAYAAHVPYGLALGLAGWRADEVERFLSGRRRPVTTLLAAVAAGLVLWLEPWHTPPSTGDATTAVRATVLVPEFTRVPAGTCVEVRNEDAVAYRLETAGASVAVRPGESVPLCPGPGVHRVRTTDEPFDGGFLIVDPTG